MVLSGVPRKKFPVTPQGIDHGTIRLVAQCLNHYATPGPTTDIQGVSRLVNISAGGDFLGLCDQKSSCKHVSDFGRLRSYDRLKLRTEGNDY